MAHKSLCLCLNKHLSTKGCDVFFLQFNLKHKIARKNLTFNDAPFCFPSKYIFTTYTNISITPNYSKRDLFLISQRNKKCFYPLLYRKISESYQFKVGIMTTTLHLPITAHCQGPIQDFIKHLWWSFFAKIVHG